MCGAKRISREATEFKWSEDGSFHQKNARPPREKLRCKCKLFSSQRWRCNVASALLKNLGLVTITKGLKACVQKESFCCAYPFFMAAQFSLFPPFGSSGLISQGIFHPVDCFCFPPPESTTSSESDVSLRQTPSAATSLMPNQTYSK